MIQWENDENALPIVSWCADADDLTKAQARNLANHPALRERVCLMPDAHVGYGMPIGGVIACADAVIPNAVGVDIGCGMGTVKTNLRVEQLGGMAQLRDIVNAIKARIPVGEGHARREALDWEGFESWRDSLAGGEVPAWCTPQGDKLDHHNLGTLGGGNHFIEIQKSESGEVWVMLHSGSRNLGQRIATHYHKAAQALNAEMGAALPDPQLAWLPSEHELGAAYIRDMNTALAYARENRRIMMACVQEVLAGFFPDIEYSFEVNIHHNYAALETHNGVSYWIHRKGATSAKAGETGIIPGSMGTASYIVEGLGSERSFQSCSHGAGRRLGRGQANRTLTLEECNAAMQGIVYDRFSLSRTKGADGQKLHDLSEAPPAYKDINMVIAAEDDLVKPLVRLTPLAVVKG
ncbi:MAG: RtcB family protein [Treponema sp.]|jgi:tRNA-splicing ligase RtcB|nr:RtcB family protein [Treponema sp.]